MASSGGGGGCLGRRGPRGCLGEGGGWGGGGGYGRVPLFWEGVSARFVGIEAVWHLGKQMHTMSMEAPKPGLLATQKSGALQLYIHIRMDSSHGDRGHESEGFLNAGD